MQLAKHVKVVHSIKRVINLDPLVLLEMQLKEKTPTVDTMPSEYTVSLIFRNLSDNVISEYRGPRKTTLLAMLESCLDHDGGKMHKVNEEEVSLTMTSKFLALNSPLNGRVTVLTAPQFGQMGEGLKEKLHKLVILIKDFMWIKNRWVRKGVYQEGVDFKSPNQDDDIYFREINHDEHTAGSMYILAHQVKVRNGQVRNRVYFHHLGKQDLLFIDDVSGHKATLPKEQRPVPYAFMHFITALEHINRLGHQNHQINLCRMMDDMGTLNQMSAYVSLTNRVDHRRLVMNFDQHTGSSKIYWFHTTPFTTKVIEAMHEIYDRYL